MAARKAEKEVLTDKRVKALKPAPNGTQYDVADAVVPGMAIRVTDKGTKTFVLYARYPRTGSPARRALGVYGALELKDAREKARGWIQLIKAGKDPKDVEEEQRAAERQRQDNTFGFVVEEYIRLKAVGPDEKKPLQKKGPEAARCLRREFIKDFVDPQTGRKRPGLGSRPIDSITKRDVLRVTDDAVARDARDQARNLFGYVRTMFNWAVDRGIYGIDSAPTDRMKLKNIVGEKEPRNRFLTDDEVFAFWRATGRSLSPQWAIVAGGRPPAGGRKAQAGPAVPEWRWRRVGWSSSTRGAVGAAYPWGTLFRLLLLTGARHGEILEARWSEIDLKKQVLIVPPERFKSKQQHMIQLSDMAAGQLTSLPRFKGEYLFSSDGGESPCHQNGKAKARLDERMLATLRALARSRGEDPRRVKLEPWVIHDLRRTMRLRLAAARAPDHVIEMILGHGRKGIQRVYDQYGYEAEMREALEGWAAKLRMMVALPPNNVVPFEARA